MAGKQGGTFTLLGSNATSGITVNNATLALGTASAAANPGVLGPGTLTIMPGSMISNPYNGALTLCTNNNQTWAGDFTFAMSGGYSRPELRQRHRDPDRQPHDLQQ